MHKRFITRQVVGRGLILVVLALALYLAVPEFGGLRDSWQVVAHAHVSSLLAATGYLFMTYVVSTIQYQWLILRRLPYLPTLLVQVACGFAGKLLPAGLGSLGLNAAYLRKQNHTMTQAATVVSVNNLLGFVGYGVVFVAAILTHAVHKPHISLPTEAILLVGSGVIVAAVTAGLLFRSKMIAWLASTVKSVRDSLRTYRSHPLRVVGVTVLAVVPPILFSAVLWCCAQSVGTHLSAATAFAVFSTGLLIGTLTPTPGGLVGAEAGLTAALVAYGVSAPQALIIALLYRFMTYWLPMLPGVLALVGARKRYI